MNKLRKILAASTIFAMTLALAPVSKVHAATDGDLVKKSNSRAVYYLNGGKLFVFPNEATYFSWYSDWNSVKVISDSEFSTFSFGGNVTVRPGTKLVKVPDFNTVYAVEPNGTLRSIVSEANAIALWGTNWAKSVIDVAPSFFTNYTVGQPLTAGVYPVGQIVNPKGTNDLYYWDGSAYRKFANESALLANRFSFNYVVTTDKTITAGGSAIIGAEAGFMNVDQGAKLGSGVYTGGSGVTVALSSETPAAMNVPKNASLVPFSKFNFTAASDGDITIKGLTLTKIGLGSLKSSEVYLYDGDTRLTSSKTINSSSNTATFSLNFKVAKGTTKTLTAMVNIDGTTPASDNNALTIVKASDVLADGATVSGSFPMNGNIMNINNTPAGTVTATMKAVANTTLKVGETQQEVAKFELTAGSAEDINISRITLTNNGSANFDDLKNFKLYRSSELVGTAEMGESNNKVILKLTTPVKIEKSGSKMFSLKADVTAGATNTIKYEVDENIDVVATGVTYGFVVAPTAVNNAASTITINAGELSLSITSPAAYNITDDADNVNLGNIDVNVKGNNPVTVRTMYGKITATNPKSGVTNLSNAIENVQLVNVTNSQTFDVTVVGTPTSTEYLFKVTNFDIPAGKTTWRVELDTIKAYVQNTEKFTFSMYADDITAAPAGTGIDAKNSDNKVITDIVTGGTIQGNPVTIKTASITMSTKNLSTGQAVANAKGVKLLEMTAKAGDSTNVKLTEVVATLAGLKNNASNYSLYVEGTTEALRSGVSASGDSGTITFTGLTNGGLVINKGEIKTLYITADIAPTITAGDIVLSIASPAGISVEDADNANTITANTTTISGRTVTLQTAGSVAFSLDSSNDTKNHIVLSGSTDNEVIKVKADATNEDIKIKTLRFKLPSTTVDRGIAKASLYQNGTKVADTTTIYSDTDDFVEFTNLDTLSTPVIVKSDTDSIFIVKLDIANVGTGANDTAVSGDVLSLYFNGGSATYIEAVGNSSNKDLVAGSTVTGTAQSKNYTTYATKLTAVKSGSQPTSLTGGENELMKFTLTPDSKNGKTAQLKTVTATISMSGTVAFATSTNNVKVYSGSNLLGTGSCTAGSACNITLDTADDISSSEVYTIKVNVSGADADDKVTGRIVINNGTDGLVWDDNKDDGVTTSIATIDLGEKSDITVIENSILY
ncbi:MAG: hypothetical protein PHR00_04550 [Patescibacteria group bacterium]|nr:hypothetical protein [Patescibacteria group bacterium]